MNNKIVNCLINWLNNQYKQYFLSQKCGLFGFHSLNPINSDFCHLPCNDPRKTPLQRTDHSIRKIVDETAFMQMTTVAQTQYNKQ